MPLRHTVYCRSSVAKVTPEMILAHLKDLDFWTLGEDYDISEDAVSLTLPLRLEVVNTARGRLYHLAYGASGTRPIEIDCWDDADQHQAVVDEAIGNLAIEDTRRAKRISDMLRSSVASVSATFGIDPPAAMFAWEVVRYFASEFDGIIDADDGEWIVIGGDYQPRLA